MGYIHNLIAQGEHEHQDFKFQISDAKKIARSIAAFANNNGGTLLVGVKDNGKIAGVRSEEEIYMIEQAACMYCKPKQPFTAKEYRVEGKTVLKVDISEASDKPVMALDDAGKWRTYYRVADENILASKVHERVLKQQALSAVNAMTYTENEHQLLDYLNTHGAISIEGYMKLTHSSRFAAETSVVALCDAGVIKLEYHAGNCLIVIS